MTDKPKGAEASAEALSDPRPGDLYMSFIRGWTDGAANAAHRKLLAQDPRSSIRMAYRDGYDRGLSERQRASHGAATLYGFDPTPFRGDRR